jgi:hypothetical protein
LDRPMLAEEVTGAVSAMAADTTPQATAAAFQAARDRCTAAGPM